MILIFAYARISVLLLEILQLICKSVGKLSKTTFQEGVLWCQKWAQEDNTQNETGKLCLLLLLPLLLLLLKVVSVFSLSPDSE